MKKREFVNEVRVKKKTHIISKDKFKKKIDVKKEKTNVEKGHISNSHSSLDAEQSSLIFAQAM